MHKGGEGHGVACSTTLLTSCKCPREIPYLCTDMGTKLSLRDEPLSSIIEDARKEIIVVPDFQRDYEWELEQLKELIASILNGYFIGSLFFLKSAPNIIKNKLCEHKPIRFIKTLSSESSHIRLVLDGQQRITSLCVAADEEVFKDTYIYREEVKKAFGKNKTKPHIDLEKVIKGYPFEADDIITEEDRVEKSDKLLIPFEALIDINKFTEWLTANEKKLTQEIKVKVMELKQQVSEYPIAIVEIEGDNFDPEDIITSFERVNSTGTPLNTFDLAVARHASALGSSGRPSAKPLRDLWEEFSDKNKDLTEGKGLIKGIDIIKLILLLCGTDIEMDPGKFSSWSFLTYKIDVQNGEVIKRKTRILKTIEDLTVAGLFDGLWDRACQAIRKAYDEFLQKRYGVLSPDWVPYTTMVVPLACMVDVMDEMSKHGKKLAVTDPDREIDKWYWTSVFYRRYQQASDSTAFQDAIRMRRRLMGLMDQEGGLGWEKAITRFDCKLLEESSTKRSVIYKGVVGLIVLSNQEIAGASNCISYYSGKTYKNDKIDIDHIFPKSYLEDIGVEKGKINSILNKSILPKSENKSKSQSLPFDFPIFPVPSSPPPDALKANLISESAQKQMYPSCPTSKRYDKAKHGNALRKAFENFIEARKCTICELINRVVQGHKVDKALLDELYQHFCPEESSKKSQPEE